jgi:hypothetical protein
MFVLVAEKFGENGGCCDRNLESKEGQTENMLRGGKGTEEDAISYVFKYVWT